MYYPYSLIIFEISAVDCVWGDWHHGACSTTCGIGSRKNTRIKLVEETNGGACPGQATEIEECNLRECQGNN